MTSLTTNQNCGIIGGLKKAGTFNLSTNIGLSGASRLLQQRVGQTGKPILFWEDKMGMKKCTKCGDIKPTSEFHRSREGKDGIRATCKECDKKDKREWRRTCDTNYLPKINGSKICTSCKLDTPITEFAPSKYQRDGRASWCIRCLSIAKLKSSYNLTPDDFIAMSESQDGKCAICGDIGNRRLDVDHDHKTGKIRGLLCTSCNNMLGRAKDNIETLKSAIIYLYKYKEV